MWMMNESGIIPQNSPTNSESHIIGEALDIGVVRKLYVMSSTSAEGL